MNSGEIFELCLMLILLLIPKTFESFRKSPSRLKRIIYIVVVVLAVLIAGLASGLIRYFIQKVTKTGRLRG